MSKTVDCGYTACSGRLDQWLDTSKDFLNKKGLNETETRNKIIDPLFKYVMGWDEKNLTREGHLNQIGYFDYEFNCGNNRFILEAKKEYVQFIMPKSNTIKLKALKDKLADFKNAIEQGIDYAVPRKINTVVVSNGSQIALTYIPFLKLSCNDTYLFHNHTKILENFSVFWNLFSPYQNIDSELRELLDKDQDKLIRNRPPFSPKVNQQQTNPEEVVEYNVLSNYLASIHDKYFTEIIDDWELLKKCYCDYEGAKQYEKNIEFVLKDRAPRISRVLEEVADFDDELDTPEDSEREVIDIKTKKRSADIFDNRFTENKNKSKMFLLVGGAGVGKTTFIHRFFNFILSEEDRNSTVWVYLDCKECSNDTDLDKFIYKKIEDELYTKYKELGIFEQQEVLLKVFVDDINKNKSLLAFLPDEEARNLKKGEIISDIISNDKEAFIKRIFEYVQKNGFGTCVVYDNVDQLDSELQKKLFQHGNVIRERFRTTVILSLREEVYYQHEHDKSFNFVECDVFHVPAPKVYSVLSKRLKTAKESLSQEDVLFDVKTSKGLSIEVKKLDILEVLSQTFMGDEDNILLLEMLSNKDIRESLRLFKKIVSSPNVNYDNLLTAAGISSIKETSDKRIPFGELIRGLALDNRYHYVSSKSKLVNIFEISNDGFFSHFTKLRILAYAQSNLSLTISTLPKGFFKLEKMYEESFRDTVKSLDTFVDICMILQREGALLNLKGTINSLEKDDFITLGPAGFYYLSSLKSNPHYLALVAIDTPLSSQTTSTKVRELYDKLCNASSLYIKNRRIIDIAEEFVKYLVEVENEEVNYLRENGSENLDNDLYKISTHIQEDVHREIERLKQDTKSN